MTEDEGSERKGPSFSGTGASIPPIPVQCGKCRGQIEPGNPTHLCNCGAVYHEKCVASLAECPECGRSIDRPVPPVTYKSKPQDGLNEGDSSSEPSQPSPSQHSDASSPFARAPSGGVTVELGQRILELKKHVAEYFKVYDTRFNEQVAVFYINIDETTLEDDFDKLRRKLNEKGYFASIQSHEGEHVLVVERKPKQKYRSVNVNLLLLIATIITTMLTGSMQYLSYENNSDIMAMFSPYYLLMGGLFFALPLMGILACHEMGHYITAKRYGLAVSLPFFIPVPPPSPLGTAGAFISMRDQIPSRKALLDIGISGPIVGLIVAIPVTIAGFILTNVVAAPVPQDSEGLVALGEPLLFMLISYLFPARADVLIHPTAFAGWVGFLVTSLNLLPMGQLDGGHVARALFGAKAKYVAYATVLAMVVMSFALFNFSYIVLMLFVVFLGLVHPPPLNDISKLDIKRKALGMIAIAMLLICFVPAPMTPIPFEEKHSVDVDAPVNIFAMPNETTTALLTINNTGNVKDTFMMFPSALPKGWRVAFDYDASNSTIKWFDGGKNVSEYRAIAYNVTLGKHNAANLTMAFALPQDATIGDVENVSIALVSQKAQKKTFYHNISVTVGYLQLSGEKRANSTAAGAWDANSIYVRNLQNDTINVSLRLTVPIAWSGNFDIANTSSNASGTGDNCTFVASPYSTTEVKVLFMQPSGAMANEVANFFLTAVPFSHENDDYDLPNETRACAFAFEVVVLPRHNLTIESNDSIRTALPSENVTFNLTLRNLGNDDENISFEANLTDGSGIIVPWSDGWNVTFSRSNIDLSPGGSVGAALQLGVPSTAIAGQYTIRVLASSPSGAADSAWVTLTVE